MSMSRTAPMRIFLVEDDQEDYMLVSEMLSHLIDSGSTLRWVPGYDEALGVLRNEKFDVCLLDYRLGTRDGLELLEEAVRSGCTTPIIFLTGTGNPDIDYAAMKAGAVDYLTKDQLNATLLERSMRYAIEIKNKNEELLRTKVIAERKQAEGDRSRLAAIVDSCDDAIVGKTLEGIITSWNRGAQTIYGYSKSEAVGKPISFLLPPGHENEVPRLLAMIKRGEPVQHYETVRRRKDGRDIHMSITISPIRDADGSLIGTSSIGRDITDHKQADEALRRSDERLRSLIKLAPVPMGLVGRNGVIRLLNDRFNQVFGYTLDDILSIEDWGRMAYPDKRYRKRLARRWKAALDNATEGSVLDHGEFDVTCKDRSVRVMEISSISVGDAVLTSFVDLTEHKRVEKALRESVEEKTSLLNEVHHRVKNNLQIVSSLLGLQAGRARNRQFADILQETRNRVKAIALLHETLYRSGNLASINFAFYVKDLCGQLLRSFGPVHTRIKPVYEIAPIGLPLKQALPCGLIVSELVSNALKHGFPNKHSGSISVRLDTSGKQTLILSVSDEGVGLPTDFDPAATATLGIQLVSRLAGQLGGRLEVRRPKGGGACFRVVFPVPAGSSFGEKS